ncbi:MAG: 3-oxoacyl-[acyl-carrier-protein] reductase [Bacteroidales bacterium]|jgi:3-oxoacyl-[acyl-carrier protein] reductase
MTYALITGASRGIGKAVAMKLAAEGHQIIINYKSNREAAEETRKSIEQQGGKAELLPFDVSSKEAIVQAIDQWKANHPDEHISILVNNAGIRKDALLMWMNNDDWDAVLNTNLNSFFHITKAVLQDMLLNKYGRIVNMVSLSGIKGLPGQTNYSAAKGGVIAATKALAQETGKKNVTVNAVAPGYIRTHMTEDLDEKQLKRMIPMNRFGKPEEVAEVVAFLASEKASYITGEVISVNGGLHT